MLSKRKAIFQCEGLIEPLSSDAEGKLLGGFGGISGGITPFSNNGKCTNGSCSNVSCINLSCKNGDCTNGECLNGSCSDLTTAPPGGGGTTPSASGRFTSVSFFM